MGSPALRSPPGVRIALIATCVLAFAPGVRADGAPPRLRPGAIEIGFAGSLVSVAGSARTTLALRGGGFRTAGPGLGGFEVELGYNHVRSLDTAELQGNVSWQHAAGSVHPFVALGGGVRQETLGSFSQARYPVGFAFGLRSLFGTGAAFRIEYRYRRLLNDPVADFTEHHTWVGFSILLRNSERPTRGEE